MSAVDNALLFGFIVGCCFGACLYWLLYDNSFETELYKRWHDEECKKRHAAQQELRAAQAKLDSIRGVLDGDVMDEVESD